MPQWKEKMGGGGGDTDDRGGIEQEKREIVK